MADVRPFRALHYDPTSRDRGRGRPALRRDRPRAARGAQGAVGAQRRRDRPAAGRRPVRPRRRRSSRVARGRDVSSATTSPPSGCSTQDYTGPDGKPYTRTRLLRARARRGVRRRAASARTSARTPARRRTASASRARRRRTSPPSSCLHDGPTPIADPATSEPVRRRHRRGRDAATALWRGARRRRRFDVGELLIADGHHRYETARVYAEEIGTARARTATCSPAWSPSRTRA